VLCTVQWVGLTNVSLYLSLTVCSGVVRGYRVHYAAVSDVTGDVLEQTWKLLDVGNSSLAEAVITGLQSDQVYVVEMSAYTRRTEGERTRQRRVKTHGAGCLLQHSIVFAR